MANQGGRYVMRNGKRELVHRTKPIPETKPKAAAKPAPKATPDSKPKPASPAADVKEQSDA